MIKGLIDEKFLVKKNIGNDYYYHIDSNNSNYYLFVGRLKYKYKNGRTLFYAFLINGNHEGEYIQYEKEI